MSDRDYWLTHCQGFSVEGAGGRVGIVQDVRRGAGPREATLAVGAGRLGRRLLLVPATEVSRIVPRGERIWLRSSFEISGSEAA